MEGRATDPLPPGANSCAVISSVTPRMCLAPELRSVRPMWRSRTIAPPRDVARESPMVVEIRFSGESGGRSILMELDGSRVVVCAPRDAANTRARTAVLLLQIHIIDSYRSRFAVN